LKAITALFANEQSEDLPFAFAESRRKEAWKRIKQLSRFIKSWQRRGSSLRFYQKRTRRRTDGNGKAVFPPVSDAEPYPELRVTPKL
jgi:hypothetical protein